MTQLMKTFGQSGLKKIAAAVLGILVLAPAAQAKDRDERVDVGFFGSNNGWGFNLDFSRDRFRRPEPAPVIVERTERVWCEPVYRTEIERVWVPPVYRTVVEKVWVPPVTREVCEKVWVEPVYEYRDVVRITFRGRIVVRERVCVQPGQFVEQRRTVVVAEGRWENVEKQVLVAEGRWNNVEKQVCVTPGRWEERVVRGGHREHDRGRDRGRERYSSWDRGSRYDD